MRALILLAACAAATPALGQQPPGVTWTPNLDLEYRQQQEQVRQQMVRQQNDLMNLEAQMRDQQAMQDIREQRSFAQPPTQAISPGAPPRIDTGQLASIPDKALAESNKRVLDASQNRR